MRRSYFYATVCDFKSFRMPSLPLLRFILFTAFSFFIVTASRGQGRITIDFNRDWLFQLTDIKGAEGPEFNDAKWRSLNVPHDWSMEGQFSEKNPAGVGGGALPGGIGWYRKHFKVSKTTGKSFIQFDGVYCNSEVWINGHYLGKRPNGYISFQYDLTPYLKPGKDNVIAVRVDNSKQPNSRWYSGSGIYRNVRLLQVNDVHIDARQTFVRSTKIAATSAEVYAGAIVVNETNKEQTVSWTFTILDKDGHVVGTNSGAGKTPNAETAFSANIKLKNHHLWSLTSPYRYTLVTEITIGGKPVDQTTHTFGIRYFNFDSVKGFSLNGEPMKIRGVCNHHDLGALGTAINTRAIERQLELLKSMGVNAIRTSHNPPAPELLDLCDKMGFIVMDEMFDMWKKKKSEFDYSLDWDEWHARDLHDFIIRDRNHPSVLIWSIGNEIMEQWDSTGIRITRELASIVRSLDTTRVITTGNNSPVPGNKLIESGALDLIGFNYNQDKFESFPRTFPGKKFIATETTSALATRGHYDMPSDSIRRWPIAWDKVFTEGNPDNTVSAYDNVSAPWGSTHEETLRIIKKNNFLSGMFIWTGFDYLGEPAPYIWPSRSSYFGIFDLAGFPKDAFYLYQSEWTDTPVLHVFPHWNHAPGETVDIWAYYNQADEVELFLNGKSMGVKSKRDDQLHVMWRLKFEPGTLKAVSRKNGKVVLEKQIHTTGKPAKMVLVPDHSVMRADGKDLSYVTIQIVDENGNVVPGAENAVTLSVNGRGKLLATDNGNPVSHESFQSPVIKSFHGLAIAIIQASEKPGTVAITAECAGLPSSTLMLNVR